MLHKNEIGVCMDDSIAYLLEEKNDENLITIIRADETEESENEVRKSKRRTRKNAFYRKVYEMIQDFDRVSLFGSASAGNEIIKQIRANKLRNVDIRNMAAEGEITENQKIDFISRYFNSQG